MKPCPIILERIAREQTELAEASKASASELENTTEEPGVNRDGVMPAPEEPTTSYNDDADSEPAIIVEQVEEAAPKRPKDNQSKILGYKQNYKQNNKSKKKAKK